LPDFQLVWHFLRIAERIRDSTFFPIFVTTLLCLLNLYFYIDSERDLFNQFVQYGWKGSWHLTGFDFQTTTANGSPITLTYLNFPFSYFLGFTIQMIALSIYFAYLINKYKKKSLLPNLRNNNSPFLLVDGAAFP
jgi:hypothetical protein